MADSMAASMIESHTEYDLNQIGSHVSQSSLKFHEEEEEEVDPETKGIRALTSLKAEYLERAKEEEALTKESSKSKEEGGIGVNFDIIRTSQMKIYSTFQDSASTSNKSGPHMSSNLKNEGIRKQTPKRILGDINISSKETSKDKSENHSGMAAVMKKVSSNLNRRSKQALNADQQKVSSVSNTFSVASGGNSMSRSKSREKSEAQINKIMKNGLMEKRKATVGSNVQPAKASQEGFKKKSYYNILKTGCREHTEKKMLGPASITTNKKLEAKVSNRVFEMIRRECVATRSVKDGSSRESSKSAQRSIKEKSVKSKKSSSGDSRKTPSSSKIDAKMFSKPTVVKVSTAEKPKSASKSLSRGLKDKKPLISLSEKTNPSSLSRKTGRILKTEPDHDDSSVQKQSSRGDSKTSNGPFQSKASTHTDIFQKDNNRKLLDLFKKMNLNESEELAIPSSKKRDDVHGLQKYTKESKEDLKVHIDKQSHGTLDSGASVKNEASKKTAKTSSSSTRQNLVSFKDFVPGPTTSSYSATGKPPGSPNHPSQLDKKKKPAIASTKGLDNHRGPSSAANTGLISNLAIGGKKTLTVETAPPGQKDKRSTSGKRSKPNPGHLNIFSPNSYLITHVHQVNNFINKTFTHLNSEKSRHFARIGFDRYSRSSQTQPTSHNSKMLRLPSESSTHLF